MQQKRKILVQKAIPYHFNHAATELVAQVRHYIVQMSGNKYFPAPIPDLDVITRQIQVLEDAYIHSLLGGIGVHEAVEMEKFKLGHLVKMLAAYVEYIANQYPEKADKIIISSGMDLKKAYARKGKEFTAKPGIEPGSVILDSPGMKHATYVYEMTTAPADEKSWKVVYSYSSTRYELKGLHSDVRYYFRRAFIVNGVKSPWSPVIHILIQ
jgi:hypothetical protein